MSMRSQTYQYWSCILIDDGSTDGGSELLHSLISHDTRFKLVRNKYPKTFAGPASARNYGLSLARTNLIAFCDIDDLWHPEKLSRQVQFHLHHDLDISVTAYSRFIDSSTNNLLMGPSICPPAELSFPKLVLHNSVPMLTVLISRDLAVTRFEQIPHEDYHFWLSIFRSHTSLKYRCLPELLSLYRVHSNNTSRTKHLLPLWTYNVYRRHGLRIPCALSALITWCLHHLILLISDFIFLPIFPTISIKDYIRQPPRLVNRHNPLYRYTAAMRRP